MARKTNTGRVFTTRYRNCRRSISARELPSQAHLPGLETTFSRPADSSTAHGLTMSDAAYIGRSDLDQDEIVKQINLFFNGSAECESAEARRAGAPRQKRGWNDKWFVRLLLSWILAHWGTGADKIAIAKWIVDPSHERPEFIFPYPCRREDGLFPAIFVIPRVTQSAARRVRRIFQHVVGAIRFAFFNLADFLADADHRITEPVELSF